MCVSRNLKPCQRQVLGCLLDDVTLNETLGVTEYSYCTSANSEDRPSSRETTMDAKQKLLKSNKNNRPYDNCPKPWRHRVNSATVASSSSSLSREFLAKHFLASIWNYDLAATRWITFTNNLAHNIKNNNPDQTYLLLKSQQQIVTFLFLTLWRSKFIAQA